MAETRTEVKTVARRRGVAAAATGAASVALLALGAPVLAAVGAGAAGLLAYRWFKYRAKNGLRF